MADLYHKHKGRYGYRRITVALKQSGVHHNHELIAKLMKQLKLSAKIRRQKYRSYKGQLGKIAKNHYYNNERIQLKLKGLSPVQYRTQSLG
ncbi:MULTISPECIES: IS3 family transposase [Psychrobacter]|uniref:IS3 family transposase n=1 Tax=Psychrobacter TaxID=497 RepID=UPI001D129227